MTGLNGPSGQSEGEGDLGMLVGRGGEVRCGGAERWSDGKIRKQGAPRQAYAS